MKNFAFLFAFIFLFTSCVFVQAKGSSSFEEQAPIENNLTTFEDDTSQVSPQKEGFWAKFKKRFKREEPPKMVETKQEWLELAKSTNRLDRQNPYKEPEKNENLLPLEENKAYFVKYNNPPGEYEVNLENIQKTKVLNSIGVASEDITKLAYVKYYYQPSCNQISSEVFVLPLDGSKSRKERLLKPNLLLSDREFTLSSAKFYLKKDLLSSLTIVDWAPDNSSLLLKEKIGSRVTGIYKTNICLVYFDPSGITIAYRRFDNLSDDIRKYWRENNNILLNFQRWDIKVLGYSKENPNEVIALAYAYATNNKEVFLGAWGLDITSGETRLISLTEKSFNISISGVIINFDYE